jgi:hypothetical protein
MRSVYRHSDAAYVVLEQQPISHFANRLNEQPNMEYVQMYMQWRGADHVLRSDTHFMFCETIQDAEIDDMELWDNTLLDGLEDDYDFNDIS